MKAIVQDRYGSADVLQVEEIDLPTMGEHDALVRVHAAGVDPGVWHLMTGLPYLVRLVGFGLRRPKVRVPGTDVAGRVEAVGARVTRVQPGDEVFGVCRGAYAGFACVQEDKLAPKPANLSFERAAAVPVSAVTALQGLRDHGKIAAGQHVLVVGASGGVGSFAVQIAKELGATVTGVCSTTKVDLVRSLGADHVIDYTREDFSGASTRYDVILDIGGNRPLSRLRRALSPRGTLVIVGGEGGDRWLGGIHRSLGALALSPFVRQRLRMFVAVTRREDLEALTHLIEAGRVTPVVDRIFPLHQVPEAIRHLERGRARGKIVVTVS